MRTKNLIVLLVILFAYTNANAWNVFVKSPSGYQLKYSSLENISINGVAEKLGYGANFYYTYMNFDDNSQQDIFCVLFKSFTDNIIGILTEDHIKELYQRDVDVYLRRYSFDESFDSYKIESCLDKGIEEKNFTLPFIAETMELKCDATQTNGMFVSEKFKYNLYFLNGILIKYEPSDGLGKWAKDVQKNNPKYFERMLLYAKQYWKDDENGIRSEINAQCDAFAELPDGMRNEHLANFNENGIYNFKMVNVLYYDDAVTLRELKDINHGNVNFVQEKTISHEGENIKVYVYKTRNGVFTFNEFGVLSDCHPL